MLRMWHNGNLVHCSARRYHASNASKPTHTQFKIGATRKVVVDHVKRNVSQRSAGSLHLWPCIRRTTLIHIDPVLAKCHSTAYINRRRPNQFSSSVARLSPSLRLCVCQVEYQVEPSLTVQKEGAQQIGRRPSLVD